LEEAREAAKENKGLLFKAYDSTASLVMQVNQKRGDRSQLIGKTQGDRIPRSRIGLRSHPEA
jgi:hypothetical protein